MSHAHKLATFCLLAATLAAAPLLANSAARSEKDARSPVVARPGVDWPSFRGERARGVADGFPTPSEFSIPEGKNILWKAPIPGLGLSSPVVWGDRVYLTTAVSASGNHSLRVGLYGDIDSVPDSASHSWWVIALDKKTGKVIWQTKAAEGEPKTTRHTKASQANSSIAVDGKRLIAQFGSEGLYAFDMEGKQLWKKDFGVLHSGYFAYPESSWGFASSPILYQDKLVIQADVLKGSFLAVFDAQSGKELWKVERDDVPTWSTPTIIDDGKTVQVAVNGFKHVGGYDFKTGEKLWWTKGGGDVPVPTPIEANGLIFFSSAHGPASPVLAIKTSARGDINMPEGQTQSDHVAWSFRKGGSYMQTPLVYGDLLYVCKDAGILTTYRVSTGEQVYQQRLASGGQTGFTASGVAADGKLYYTAETGEVFIVKAGPTYEAAGKGDLGEPSLASPAVSEGVLYFRGKDHLVAVANVPAKAPNG